VSYRPPRLKDFPIDHRVIAVADTPAMAAIAGEIAALQARYDKLREAEQRSQFAAYLRTVRDNVNKALHR
jgi:hypothetical protein